MLLVFAVLAFRRERRREPGFIPPSDGITYANVHEHLGDSNRDDDPYADKHEPAGSAVAPMATHTGYESYAYSGARANDQEDAFGRPSMDAYGAFDESHGRGGGMATSPGVDETSRTMQLAYTDPCESCDQNLADPKTLRFAKVSWLGMRVNKRAISRYTVTTHLSLLRTAVATDDRE